MPPLASILDRLRAHWPTKFLGSSAVLLIFPPLYLLAQRFPFREAAAASPSPLDCAIPFVPSAIYVYLSLWLLMPVAPWLMRERAEVMACSKALSFIFGCALAVFLVFPTACHRPNPPVDAVEAYHLMVRIDGSLNAFPSLHAAFAVFSALACPREGGPSVAGRRLRLGLWIWAAAILASALLVKQHALIDVLGGALLGAAGHAVFMRKKAPAAEGVPASPGLWA